MIRREDEIARDDHPHRKAWPDRQSRLDIEVASDNLLAGLIEALCAATPQSLNERIFIARRAELRADPENGRERGGAGETKPMMINFVLKPRLARCIGSWLALENDRAPVGENEPVPDEQHARLSEGDLRSHRGRSVSSLAGSAETFRLGCR